MVDAAGPKKKGAPGVRKKSRVEMRIDMTPMVDIAFLLVIFFMTTTRFREPQAIEIALPKKGQPKKTKQSNVLVLNLDAQGKLTSKIGDATPLPIKVDSLDSLLRNTERENIRKYSGDEVASRYEQFYWLAFEHADKKMYMDTLLDMKEKASKLTVLIQVDTDCYYKSVVEVMDAVNNARMARFSVVRAGLLVPPPTSPSAPAPAAEPAPPEPTGMIRLRGDSPLRGVSPEKSAEGRT
jgi:biopolymer transport protein ExbD